MSIEILPSDQVTPSDTVMVRETTLLPGDSLVITTDAHLDDIDAKISKLELSDTDIKQIVNSINEKLNASLNGVRLVGIIDNTNAEVKLNKQLLTDFVNARYTKPGEELKVGDVVSTKDKYTYVYLRNEHGAEEWTEYNVGGDLGDILNRIDTLEASKTTLEGKVNTLESYKTNKDQEDLARDGKITTLEGSVSTIEGKIGDLNTAGYVANTASEMFKEIKTGMESYNSKLDTGIRDILRQFQAFAIDITSQVQSAESNVIQASGKITANTESIRLANDKITELTNKDTELGGFIGTLSNLQTGNKLNLVEALNEVYGMINALTGGSSGGGIEATVLKLSNALGAVDTLGGETIMSALEKLKALIDLKAEAQAVTDLTNKIGSDSINGELTQNIIGAINDLLLKFRAVDEKFPNFLALTGGELTGTITYNGVDSFSGKQIPHADWIKAKIDAIVGELSTTGLSSFSTIGECLKELKTLLDSVTVNVSGVSDKIGDLSTTGLTAQDTVANSLKELKDLSVATDGNVTAVTERVRLVEEGKADKSSVENVKQDLELLKGANVVIDILTETKDQVEGQLDKEQWLNDKVTAAGKGQPKDGYELKTSDGYSYIYKNSQWKLMSTPPVASATTDTQGIIKLKDEDGFITSSGLGDGTVKLHGYSALTSGIQEAKDLANTKVAQDAYDIKIGTIESSITANTQLAQEAKDIAEANKLKVTANESAVAEANRVATQAQSDAASAISKATSAETVAGEANSKVDAAVIKVNAFETKVDSAVSDSSAAKSTAEEAKTQADAAKQESSAANTKALEVEGKLGTLSNVTGSPLTIEEGLTKLHEITGELGTISGISNTNLAESIMGVLGKVTVVEGKLDTKFDKAGGQLTGVTSYDSSVQNFSGNEIPHAAWVESKITTIGVEVSGALNQSIQTVEASATAAQQKATEVESNLGTAKSELTGAIATAKSDLTQNIQTAKQEALSQLQADKIELDNKITANTNLIGDLSATDIPGGSNSTVEASLRHLKGETTTLTTEQTAINRAIDVLRDGKADASTVTSLQEELALVKGAKVIVAILTENKDEVEGKLDKQDFLTQKAKESGRKQIRSGYEIRTADGYSYYYHESTWYLIDKIEITNASVDAAGLVKFKESVGYVTNSPEADGTAIVKGFSELQTAVAQNTQGLLDKVTERQVDDKILPVSTKVTSFEQKLNENTERANLAVQEISTLSQTVTQHGLAIEQLRDNKIGNIDSTGFSGTNVGDMFRSVRSEVDDRITESDAETKIREAFDNVDAKITAVDGKADTKLDASVYNTEKSSFLTASSLDPVNAKIGDTSALLTTERNSTVGAINELKTELSSSLKVKEIRPGESLPQQTQPNTLYVKGI